VSGTAGVITEGMDGYSRPVGDLEGMADALTSLAQDRGRLAAMGAAAACKGRGYSYHAYLDWFLHLNDAVWAEQPRCWPVARPYVTPGNDVMRRLVAAFPAVSKLAPRIQQLLGRGL
jgi:hypothetical protein